MGAEAAVPEWEDTDDFEPGSLEGDEASDGFGYVPDEYDDEASDGFGYAPEDDDEFDYPPEDDDEFDYEPEDDDRFDYPAEDDREYDYEPFCREYAADLFALFALRDIADGLQVGENTGGVESEPRHETGVPERRGLYSSDYNDHPRAGLARELLQRGQNLDVDLWENTEVPDWYNTGGFEYDPGHGTDWNPFSFRPRGLVPVPPGGLGSQLPRQLENTDDFDLTARSEGSAGARPRRNTGVFNSAGNELDVPGEQNTGDLNFAGRADDEADLP